MRNRRLDLWMTKLRGLNTRCLLKVRPKMLHEIIVRQFDDGYIKNLTTESTALFPFT